MLKVLIVTTVSGFVPQFEMNNVSTLQNLGFEVHYASNFFSPVYGSDNNRLDNTGIIRHQIDFVRSPFQLNDNYEAYKQLVKLMKENDFSLVHCHTPMGGVIARLAAKKNKMRNIIYTAHGFHFYSGAPIINWLFYYPVERLLARCTDIIATITKEDYIRALKFKIRNQGKVIHINGVGINVNDISNKLIDKEQKRLLLGIPSDAVVLLSVGELNSNKNHESVIKALAKLNKDKFYYIICGKGQLLQYLTGLSKGLDLENNILFAGYREDIYDIMQIADIFILPSIREGLSVSIMEAMASGLPVICSNIRGNKDLIDDGIGGYLANPKSTNEFAKIINTLIESEELRKKMGYHNKVKSKSYNQDIIKDEYEAIYKKLVNY